MYRELLANGSYSNATEYAQLLAFAKAEFEEEVAKAEFEKEIAEEEYEPEKIYLNKIESRDKK